MNRLLRELEPTDLQSITGVRRRLDERLARVQQALVDLGERRRLLDTWLERTQPPSDLSPKEVAWEDIRQQLQGEREAVTRSLEEEKRAIAILREAVKLLASFIELATGGIDTESGFTPEESSTFAPLTGPLVTPGAGRLAPADGANIASAPMVAEAPTVVLEWRGLARACLEKRGPLHYRDLYQHLRSQSVIFGGAHPAGTFLATLNRDSGFVRVGRGVYWLADRPLPPADGGVGPTAPARRTTRAPR